MTETQENQASEVSEATESTEQNQEPTTTLDSIMAEARSEVAIENGEEPKEPEKKDEPAKQAEDNSDESEESQEDTAEEKATKEGSEDKPKKKGKKTAGEHISELKEEKKQTQAKHDAERASDRKRMAELEKLVEQSLKPKKEAEEEEEFVPLDPEAHERYQKELKEMKTGNVTTDFVNAVKLENAIQTATDAQWGIKNDAVVHSEALDMIVKGKAETEDEALQMAYDNIAADMFDLHKKGKSIPDYINRRAQTVAARYPKGDKKETDPSDKEVDMVKLNKLRETAGKPTNKIATQKSKGEGGFMANVVKEARAEVYAEDTL